MLISRIHFLRMFRCTLEPAPCRGNNCAQLRLVNRLAGVVSAPGHSCHLPLRGLGPALRGGVVSE